MWRFHEINQKALNQSILIKRLNFWVRDETDLEVIGDLLKHMMNLDQKHISKNEIG